MNSSVMVPRTILFFSLLSSVVSLNLQANTSERKPWGTYEIINESELYKIKKITVLPQKRLSLQRHKYRAEYWVIIQGNARVTLNDAFDLADGAMIHVKQTDIHRIENIGTTDLIFIEVQTGTYFGEDDIERLDDDYGRK